MTPDQKEAQARMRYFVMTGARIGGVVLVVLGIATTTGRFEGVPAVAGYALAVIGLIDMVLVPRILARRWRTPPAA